eukprot:gene25818-biopygen4532
MKKLQCRRRCQEQERASPPHCVLFCSVLFCSVMCGSVLLCSVLLCSVLFCPVLPFGPARRPQLLTAAGCGHLHQPSLAAGVMAAGIQELHGQAYCTRVTLRLPDQCEDPHPLESDCGSSAGRPILPPRSKPCWSKIPFPPFNHLSPQG